MSNCAELFLQKGLKLDTLDPAGVPLLTAMIKSKTVTEEVPLMMLEFSHG